ncbi:hypothetical protein CK247_31545, partial [Klebsiella pneumoniae]
VGWPCTIKPRPPGSACMTFWLRPFRRCNLSALPDTRRLALHDQTPATRQRLHDLLAEAFPAVQPERAA